MDQILEKYFGYYRKLSPEKKKEFRERVENFIFQKDFFSKAELPSITEEMKVLVASNAVQLTFGLKEILFDHFKTILLYPDEFYSHFSQSNQKGEANPEGVLVFSWKHLALGNLLPDKSENIGLRVFAIALGIQHNTEGPEYDILQNSLLHHWKALADQEFEKIKSSGKVLYSRKGVLLREDFFPVSVECFFQEPESLKKEYLELYNALASLLNQYP